jgi:hypothetical protein
VHQRVVSIMAWQRRYDLVSTWKGAPLLYVRPRLAGYGTFDFEHVEYFLDEGYRAMCHALPRDEPRPADAGRGLVTGPPWVRVSGAR